MHVRQNVADPGPNLVDVVPSLLDYGPSLVDSVQVLVEIGRFDSSPGPFIPGQPLVETGRLGPEASRIPTKPGRFQARMADACRGSPELGHPWPERGQLRPVEAKLDRTSAACGRPRPVDGPMWANTGLNSNNLMSSRSGPRTEQHSVVFMPPARRAIFQGNFNATTTELAQTSATLNTQIRPKPAIC